MNDFRTYAVAFNTLEIVMAIDEALSHKSRDEWGEIFDSEGIIWVRYWPSRGSIDAQAEALDTFPQLNSEEIVVSNRCSSNAIWRSWR